MNSFCQNHQPDSVQISIEQNYFNTLKWRPAYYHEIITKLNLPLIEKCTDSFSLRLWAGSMFGYQVGILSRTKDNWEFHQFEYYDSAKLKELKPKGKISIPPLIDSLKLIDFKSLISQWEIKDFQDIVDDGTTYTLEVSFGNSYRILQYHSPEYNSDKEGYNKRFANVIHLLDKYLRFY